MSGKAERAARRSRRLSTDSEDEQLEYDWSDRRQRQNTAAASSKGKPAPETNTSRSRRAASGAQPAPMASVARLPSSSPSSQQSLHFTVKLPSSKLRQATGMAPPGRSSGKSATASSRDPFAGGEIIEGKRARNVKKSYVVESDSDEEDEEMEDVEEEDAEGESGEEEEDEDMADQDAEGEEEEDDEEEEEEEDDDGEDADGDIDMEIPLPPPTIKISKVDKTKKSIISVKPSGKPDGKTVEEKETADGSDDEELSELESDIEEEEEGMQLGGEEDAEGEDEEEEEEIEGDDDEEEDEELDSDDETPAGGSRASTPDLTKLTKRQRARLEEGGSGHLLALPDEVQVKKHLTAEEHAMRRAEMARRRKNLSEKRNEEEKMETINKLLKKQAPKTNSRRGAFNGFGGADAGSEGEVPRPSPIFVRWVSNKDGNRIGVPEEWMEAPVGVVLAGPEGFKSRKLIEEVQ